MDHQADNIEGYRLKHADITANLAKSQELNERLLAHSEGQSCL